MLPERTWLQWVRRQAQAFAPARRSELRLGIGDDAALVRPRRGWELVLTTDLLVENVHFLRARDPAPVCGRRLATRALSDLAAMGSEPLALLVSAALPPDLPTAWARGFYRGFLAASREAGATLIGGDSSASPRGIVLDAVGVGQVPAGKALRRSGARPGDRIFVSGPLGEAAWGRELVQGQQPVTNAAARRARARHLHPRARWELGAALRGRASAAMDISDGLAIDLDHLCRESGVGAEILAVSLPAPAGLQRALSGGEDYELLFTLPPHRRLPRQSGMRRQPGGALSASGGTQPGVEARTPSDQRERPGQKVASHCEIGRIIAGSGCWLLEASGRRRRLSPRGWQHWA